MEPWACALLGAAAVMVVWALVSGRRWLLGVAGAALAGGAGILLGSREQEPQGLDEPTNPESPPVDALPLPTDHTEEVDYVEIPAPPGDDASVSDDVEWLRERAKRLR